MNVFTPLLQILHVYGSYSCCTFLDAELSYRITVQIQVWEFLNEKSAHFHHGAFEMETQLLSTLTTA
jgi:hypothetical protein